MTADSTSVFFGVNVSCARCHDHPLVSDWTQDHYYGMASFFVRTAEEWKEVIADNPFPKEAQRDPGHLVALFLKGTADTEHVKALQVAIKGREIVRGEGRQAYIFYPDGIGRSRLTPTLIEKKLATRATGRNWNTVLKIGALIEQ